ncbi:MAG: hypothetical protein AAGA09_05170 [Pseudomonadota bacterium]
MSQVRNAGAFLGAVAVAYLLATAFSTQQVIAKQAAFGATYTPAQQFQTLIANLTGFWAYGAMLAIALGVGFFVAMLVKRVLTPLAPIAYPVAGAAAVGLMIYLIENVVLPGGVGIIGGARDALGVALQMGAGASAGVVFEMLRVRRA